MLEGEGREKRRELGRRREEEEEGTSARVRQTLRRRVASSEWAHEAAEVAERKRGRERKKGREKRLRLRSSLRERQTGRDCLSRSTGEPGVGSSSTDLCDGNAQVSN